MAAQTCPRLACPRLARPRLAWLDRRYFPDAPWLAPRRRVENTGVSGLPGNLDPNAFKVPTVAPTVAPGSGGERPDHPPRILLLYGSLRARSYSRFLTLEAERLLRAMGARRGSNANGLPLPDDAGADHPKVRELRDLSLWSEGQVWCSPERHGNLTGVMKAQIDWIPLSLGATGPTQGRTLALMQVSGRSQSFNTVDSMRLLGRWMRMVTIPNQSSVPKAWQEFDAEGRMRASPLYDRVVDVMEELVKFTLITGAAPTTWPTAIPSGAKAPRRWPNAPTSGRSRAKSGSLESPVLVNFVLPF